MVRVKGEVRSGGLTLTSCATRSSSAATASVIAWFGRRACSLIRIGLGLGLGLGSGLGLRLALALGAGLVVRPARVLLDPTHGAIRHVGAQRGQGAPAHHTEARALVRVRVWVRVRGVGVRVRVRAGVRVRS